MDNIFSYINEQCDFREIIESIGINIKNNSDKKFSIPCPFHNETIPSCSITDNGFYCFGCKVHGDKVQFVYDYFGMNDKISACKKCAELCHVTIPEQYLHHTSGKNNNLYKSNEEYLKLCEGNSLESVFSNDYFKHRGLTERTIKEFRLGFAIEKDIASKIENNNVFSTNGYYLFENKYIIPIISNDKVVGFGARVKEGASGSKYINSANSEIYNKSEVIFGFDTAKNYCKNFMIITEGYFDVMMCHQVGMKNCVCMGGTSINEYHLLKIKKKTDNLLLCMDGDEAGYKSIKRTLGIALKLGFMVKVVIFDKGQDLADFIKDDGNLIEKLSEKQDALLYLLNDYITGKELIEINKVLINEIYPLINGIQSEVVKEHYLREISKKLEIDFEKIKLDYNK